jgi:hypothetical protein
LPAFFGFTFVAWGGFAPGGVCSPEVTALPFGTTRTITRDSFVSVLFAQSDTSFAVAER